MNVFSIRWQVLSYLSLSTAWKGVHFLFVLYVSWLGSQLTIDRLSSRLEP